MLNISVNPMDPLSVSKALRYINEYKTGFSKKLETLRKRIADELKDDVKVGFNGALYNDVLYEGKQVPDVQVFVDEDDGKLISVVADGKDAVFIEFGAGVYYNPPAGSFPHPNAPDGIVAIGTYGQGYGSRKIWGYYENGELKLTHGTPASMPMYYAAKDIAEKIPSIAREVFAGG